MNVDDEEFKEAEGKKDKPETPNKDMDPPPRGNPVPSPPRNTKFNASHDANINEPPPN